MNRIVELAAHFAEGAHCGAGQVRKYTNEPYIIHPKAVVGILRTRIPFLHNALAAAWLHDVVEDTQVSHATIRNTFGNQVADYVFYLTDMPTTLNGPNREERKRQDRERLSRAPALVKTIKLADLIDNTKDIVRFDPSFAKVYLEEKRLLLEVLQEGDSILWDRASEQVN